MQDFSPKYLVLICIRYEHMRKIEASILPRFGVRELKSKPKQD